MSTRKKKLLSVTGAMMLSESQAVCSTHSAQQYTAQEVMFGLYTMDLPPHTGT